MEGEVTVEEVVEVMIGVVMVGEGKVMVEVVVVEVVVRRWWWRWWR